MYLLVYATIAHLLAKLGKVNHLQKGRTETGEAFQANRLLVSVKQKIHFYSFV
ncbi:hypothetical protein [Sphaerochaeta pleomorpha]|uniref:hypothetical protein n=1 Tax=Sphaerochaeta pleomorpha TaxID=1131707 RepID=UPI0012DCD7AA|nr:hypothetical protein [Sphaerochaeta pleomorpha]